MTPATKNLGVLVRFFVLLLSLLTFGCANSSRDECGGSVLLLWPSQGGEFKFQEIQIPTLKSFYELDGAAGRIYFENRISNSGFDGSVARPNLARSKGVCIPMDTDSSVALTVYAIMDRIYAFDRALGVDRQVTWPRKVGVNTNIRSQDGGSHDNAHYFSGLDSMAVVPYDQSGLPLGLNPGVVAHEHFHAHFQSQVNNPLNQALGDSVSLENFFYLGFGIKPGVEDLDGADSEVRMLNKFVVRGWNEGLADYYGSVFSGSPEFFSASLPHLSKTRDLNGPLQVLMSGAGLRRQAQALDSEGRRSLVGLSYLEGTFLARLLNRISSSGAVSPRELVTRILNRLDRIQALSAEAFSTRVMDFEEVVPVLIDGLTLNADACEAVRAVVTKPTFLRSFAQCAR